MKRLLTLFFALCAFSMGSGQGSASISATGTAVQMYMGVAVRATICTITANSANTASIYLGFSSGVAASNGTELKAGASYACMPAGNTAFWSLGEFWINGTSGDGVKYSWK